MCCELEKQSNEAISKANVGWADEKILKIGNFIPLHVWRGFTDAADGTPVA